MPSSRNIIDKEQAETVVVNYQPKSIDSILSDEALEYVKNQETRGDFRVDKIVAEYVGIEELEKEEQQREVARQAIEKSQEIQESAYKKAYELGMEEGRNAAYEEEKETIHGKMNTLEEILSELRNVKNKIMFENEKQIVALCFYISKRLLMKEISENPDYIKTVIKKTLEMAQSEQEVVIHLSEADKSWVDEYYDSMLKELNLDSSTRFEESRDIKKGGVVVETHHGVIDATVEQRLDKLESILKNDT